MQVKNSYIVGLLAGIIFPALFFGILYGLNVMLAGMIHSIAVLPLQKLLFISAVLNILPFRYLFVKLNLEKTGAAMLIITVIIVITIMLVF